MALETARATIFLSSSAGITTAMPGAAFILVPFRRL
jgi:hypothetical protein